MLLQDSRLAQGQAAELAGGPAASVAEEPVAWVAGDRTRWAGVARHGKVAWVEVLRSIRPSVEWEAWEASAA